MYKERDRYEVELEKARRVAIAYPASLYNKIATMRYIGSETTKNGTVNDYYYDRIEDRYYYEPDFAKRWRINQRNKRIKK